MTSSYNYLIVPPISLKAHTNYPYSKWNTLQLHLYSKYILLHCFLNIGPQEPIWLVVWSSPSSLSSVKANPRNSSAIPFLQCFCNGFGCERLLHLWTQILCAHFSYSEWCVFVSLLCPHVSLWQHRVFISAQFASQKWMERVVSRTCLRKWSERDGGKVMFRNISGERMCKWKYTMRGYIRIFSS